MVQYVFTPWRDRRELLAVRSQFYPEKNLHHQPNSGPLLRDGSGMLASPEQPGNEDEYEAEAAAKEREEQEQQQQQQQQAVARVSMWMHRGACPHLVESTALLTAALLSDDGLFLGLGRRRRGWGWGGGNWISSSAADEEALQGQQQQQQQERIAEGESGSAQASRGYAVRAAYSAAFSRFVTGLLDSHQDKQRKMSMYDVAKSVGLPATFVELRHQATHEQLPSLTRLRAAARKALDWIWDYYWKHLTLPPAEGDIRGGGDTAGSEHDKEERRCREVVMRYLEAGEADSGLEEEIMSFDEAVVLTTLGSISETTRDTSLLRRALAFSRAILERGRDPDRMDDDEVLADERLPKDIERVRAELGKAWEEMREMEEAAKGPDLMEAVDSEVEMAEDTPGWTLYEEETWTPKPIGVV